MKRAISFSLLVVVSVMPSVSAQNPYYPNVYRPSPPGWGGNPYGPNYNLPNPWSGQADIISAQGNVLLQQEQARILREQASQAKLATKRQTFDEMMYENANKLTFAERKELDQASLVRRIMSNPTPTEVRSGTAANTVAPYITKLGSMGIHGPTIYLDQELMKQINVRAGESGPEIGPLSDGGKVHWPFALRGETSAKLDKSLPIAVSQAIQGELNRELYLGIKADVAKLSKELPPKYHKTQEIDTGEYLDAKHFLESLEKGVTALPTPQAKSLFTGTRKASGKTVLELITNMNQSGLTFAPATPGYDEAYFALHSSMVAYATSAQNVAGMRVPLVPSTSLDNYKK